MPKKSEQKVTLVAHDLGGALKGRKKVEFLELSKFNVGSVGVFVSGKGTSPWECHSDSDEFLQVLDGEVDVEVLTETGSVTRRLEAEECLVVPMGSWHRHVVPKFVRELFVTPGASDHSTDRDPRKSAGNGAQGAQSAGNGQAARSAKNAADAKNGENAKDTKNAINPVDTKNTPTKHMPTKAATDTQSAKNASNAKDLKTAAAEGNEKSLPEQIREYALTFPETREDHPWGYPAFKVKNKMFVAFSFREHGIMLTVKLTKSRLAASALPCVQASGYGLGEHGWVSADLKHGDTILSVDTLKSWIKESYCAVAPKTVLKEYDKSLVETRVSKARRAYNK